MVPTLRANGIEIYYEIHGAGDPLLMIAGLGMDLTQSESVIAELSSRHRLIAFDNRGSGRTDKPDAPYSIDMVAEDAAGLVEALDERRVNVLGVSMGGRIAISLALRHPEMVERIVLVSTSARMPRRRGLIWSLSNLLVRLPAVRRIGTKHPQPHYAYVRQREASRDCDVTHSLSEVRAPTLILHGTKDGVVPFELAEEMHEAIGGSKMKSFDGGHLLLFSGRKDLFAAVEEFLGSEASGRTA